MNDKDYNNLIHLKNAGGGFLPANDKAQELLALTKQGDIIVLDECTKRDLKYHKCFMSLLGFVWDYLTPPFKERVPKRVFYNWLKEAQGLIKYEYEFNDGSKYKEYESISFGNMSEIKFKEYVANQLTFIYGEIIPGLFPEQICANIIDTIEEEYKKFLSKLL